MKSMEHLISSPLVSKLGFHFIGFPGSQAFRLRLDGNADSDIADSNVGLHSLLHSCESIPIGFVSQENLDLEAYREDSDSGTRIKGWQTKTLVGT